jgi:hypothetical protein
MKVPRVNQQATPAKRIGEEIPPKKQPLQTQIADEERAAARWESKAAAAGKTSQRRERICRIREET